MLADLIVQCDRSGSASSGVSAMISCLRAGPGPASACLADLVNRWAHNLPGGSHGVS